MPEMEFGPADIPERKPDLSLYERLQDITTGLNKVEAILQKNDARLAIGAAMDSDDWTSAALRYTECVARFSPTEVHELLADVQRIHPRPKLYTTSSDRGEITNAAFDNSYFNDTILYESPTVKGIPLEDAKLERLALHLEAVKQLERNGSSGVAIGRLEIKEAG
ncbi:MAG: hypothetical protein K2W95_26975 [Candidatus Obscuribacterales bacterium]|nr:hypothetical protein [Candidatus Obscuribacterales bacterium]